MIGLLKTPRKKLFIAALIGIGLILSFYSRSHRAETKVENAIVYDATLFHNGDIIFRKGRSLLSEAVLAADNQTPFSHAGIIKIVAGQAFVIHAVTGEELGSKDIVKLEPLAQFLAADRATAAGIYRLTQDTQHYADKAVATAAVYAQQALPFDGDFDLATTNKLYCTELVWRAYQAGGVDLVDGQFDKLSVPMSKGDYILPSRLLKSHWLTQVCYLEAGK